MKQWGSGGIRGKNREGEEELGMGDWIVKKDGLAEGGGAERGEERVGPVRKTDLEWEREGICREGARSSAGGWEEARQKAEEVAKGKLGLVKESTSLKRKPTYCGTRVGRRRRYLEVDGKGRFSRGKEMRQTQKPGRLSRIG